MPDPPVITLTTDFKDGPFAGVMKGVMLSIRPDAQLVDLSHAVPPGDVRAGALFLEQALGVFPFGTVHLAVVDPGVGGIRRPICVQALGMLFVGPDNGVFTPVFLADVKARARLLADEAFFRKPVSQTFHGRDVFAPVAARLASGLEPSRLGPEISDPVLLDWPLPEIKGDTIRGVVLGADSFGNLCTNIPRNMVQEFLRGRGAVVRLPGLEVAGISASYSAAMPGQDLALFNSLDRLELARNQGDLRSSLGWDARECFGRPVRLEAGRD